MKRLFFISLLLATQASVSMAEDHDGYTPGTDAPEPSGFVTSLLNNALEKAASPTGQENGVPEYGRNVTQWASIPKFGGYAIGTYKYSDQSGSHGGDGFNARFLRLYVDGTILTDFKYRIQLEMSGDPATSNGAHLKDYFLSWSHWKELEVKVGQFKRCFTFENPYNPWDVGTGDYSQLTKKLAGMRDYCGGESTTTGGRDLGLQLQGDLFPIGKDKHRLVHYQAGIFNGQGINHADANRRKDLIGSLQVQPIKDLFIGVFGWKGDMTYNKVTAERNRYAISAKYEHNGWSARAEYAHHTGHKIADFTYNEENKTQELKPGCSNGQADGWYVTVGVPCTPWLKVYAKYDAYRETAANSSLNTIYSICPNFQIHKNIMLQAQYNYVHNKLASEHHNEFWGELYFRF